MDHGQSKVRKGVRLFAQGDNPPPAPPPGYDDELSTPELYTPKSVTHVLGPKCHLCPHSFRPRLWPSYITLPSAFASRRRHGRCRPSAGSPDRASRDGWTEGAVGRPQPRSRASSPGETPAGDDCQIVSFVFCQQDLFMLFYLLASSRSAWAWGATSSRACLGGFLPSRTASVAGRRTF